MAGDVGGDSMVATAAVLELRGPGVFVSSVSQGDWRGGDNYRGAALWVVVGELGVGEGQRHAITGYIYPGLVERLWSRITRKGPKECWPWRGAKSKSGRRQVCYPHIPEGGGKGRPFWRVNRLLLVLTHGPLDVPPDDQEPFLLWLHRARRYYRDLGVEAAHTCDNSECCNPGHLQWESHQDNLQRQRTRQARQQAVA